MGPLGANPGCPPRTVVPTPVGSPIARGQNVFVAGFVTKSAADAPFFRWGKVDSPVRPPEHVRSTTSAAAPNRAFYRPQLRSDKGG